MPEKHRRTTVYLDPEIHRALRIKAAETDRTVSDLVNSMARAILAEEAEDLASFEERAAEPDLPFESVLKDFRLRGKL